MDVISLTGDDLSIEQVVALAEGAPGKPAVELALEAEARVRRAQQAVADLVARGEIAYGITTGFGAFKDRSISPDQVEQLQRNIIMSHAVGVGEPFGKSVVRASSGSTPGNA